VPPSPQRAAIVRSAIGIGIYAAAFGATFGALAVAAGLGRGQAQALSLVLFSGASQLAFAGVVGSGGSAWTALGPTLLLALRNGFYGVTLAPVLRSHGLRRLVTAHLVIDETTAMATAQTARREQRMAFWWTGLVLFACWNAGTFVGAVVGSAVDTDAFGLDAAGPAVFLALVWPAFRRVRARWVGLAGAVIAVALVPFAPSGVPVLAAAAAAVVGGLLPQRDPDSPPAPAGPEGEVA
jgi:4-azaleucine resistance transporter AzlC